jgi:hypothetical protein
MTLQENLATERKRRRRYTPSSPSELLISLHRRYPHKPRDEIIELFADVLPSHEEPQRIANKDWASLNYNRLTHAGPTREERAAARASRAAWADLKAAKFEQNLLMNVVLPLCGKRLEEATFAECRKEGGWLSEIGKMGKPREIVGMKLTEKELKAAL